MEQRPDQTRSWREKGDMSYKAEQPEPQTIVDCKDAAESVGLSYASTDDPGLTRRRAGKGFSYRSPDRRVITDMAILARIRALAIPPAWERVWICADPNGHIQAA